MLKIVLEREDYVFMRRVAIQKYNEVSEDLVWTSVDLLPVFGTENGPKYFPSPNTQLSQNSRSSADFFYSTRSQPGTRFASGSLAIPSILAHNIPNKQHHKAVYELGENDIYE